jgi:hypothetical protein
MGKTELARLGMPLPFQAPKRKISGGLGDSVPQMWQHGFGHFSQHPRCLLLLTTNPEFVSF